jgi:hypothetical protein
LFSDDVMCATDRQTDRQTTFHYIHELLH